MNGNDVRHGLASSVTARGDSPLDKVDVHTKFCSTTPSDFV